MKRITFFIAVLLIGMMSLQAKPVEKILAQTAAQKFATAQLALERSTPELVYTGQNEAFFVFNLDNLIHPLTSRLLMLLIFRRRCRIILMALLDV